LANPPDDTARQRPVADRGRSARDDWPDHGGGTRVNGLAPGPERRHQADDEPGGGVEQRAGYRLDGLAQPARSGEYRTDAQTMARVRDALRPERPSLEPRRDDRPATALERDGFRPERTAFERRADVGPAAAPRRDGLRPERTGADIGPDAYRDDGRGAGSDRHGFRSERTSLEADRPIRDRGSSGGSTPRDSTPRDSTPRGGYSHSPPEAPDRSRVLHGDGPPDRARGLQPDGSQDLPRGLPGDNWPRRSEMAPERGGDRGDTQSSVRDRARAVGEGNGPVPRHRNLDGQPSPVSDDGDDDTLTRPLPVILPGATALPRPGHVEAPRGPFEPARPSQPSARPASITGSVEPPPATFSEPMPPPPRPMPDAAVAKLDQIKDLYLTAEAIGEDALDKHFDQVSQRQRELIREFFDRSKPAGGGEES
jgi:hypothetical protein